MLPDHEILMFGSVRYMLHGGSHGILGGDGRRREEVRHAENDVVELGRADEDVRVSRLSGIFHGAVPHR
jgi:hypothetical protein